MKKYLTLLVVFSQFAFAGGKRTFSVMTYNLENLFDTVHDEGKKDWTYLPLAFKQTSQEVQDYCNSLSNEWYKKSCLELDWSEEVLDSKISNVSKVIKEYNHGLGADILVFQEIENINALTLLQKKGLKHMGYKELVLIEGPDSRGIDVAIMSKFPLKSKRLHEVSMKPYSDRVTRGILEATFQVFDKTVTVFANHWPSQANPDGTRLNASNVLVAQALKATGDIVIAAGDFNTVEDDEINALKLNIQPYFVDVEKKGRQQSRFSAPGTHWYRGEWESLDKIFVLKRSLRNLKGINHSSFRIVYENFMLRDLEWTNRDTGETRTDKNIPHRFNPETGLGFSDHLPVGIDFTL